MKIAFDAKRAFRNFSGLGNYSRTVVRQLCEYFPGNEYVLFTPKKGKIEESFPPANATLKMPENPFLKFFNSYWRTFTIGNVLRKEMFDLYHGLSNELPYNIHKSGVKSVVTIHDLIFIRFPELYKPVDRYIYLRKFRAAALNSNLVIAISNQTRSDIINYLNIPEEKIKVVYQSGNPLFSKIHTKDKLDEIRKKYNLPGEFILNVGTIEERKNLLQLLRALNETKSQIPLVVVGHKRKDYFRKIEAHIERNRIKNIYFLQNVPTIDLPLIYQSAKLFVYPSSFEGFGIPVLEAMQSGIPVIAGKGHCLEETGGPDSLYIDPFDLEEFSDAIDQVLESDSQQKKMSTTGLKYAERFHPEKTVRKVYSAYESIL